MWSFSQSKSLATLQNKYADDNSFTLNMSGNWLNALFDSDELQCDEDLKQFIRKVSSLKVLVVGKNAKHYSAKDLKKLKAEIKRANFEELVSVKSGDGNLTLMIKDRNGKFSELILLADEDDQGFVTIDLKNETDED